MLHEGPEPLGHPPPPPRFMRVIRRHGGGPEQHANVNCTPPELRLLRYLLARNAAVLRVPRWVCKLVAVGTLCCCSRLPFFPLPPSNLPSSRHPRPHPPALLQLAVLAAGAALPGVAGQLLGSSLQ